METFLSLDYQLKKYEKYFNSGALKPPSVGPLKNILFGTASALGLSILNAVVAQNVFPDSLYSEISFYTNETITALSFPIMAYSLFHIGWLVNNFFKRISFHENLTSVAEKRNLVLKEVNSLSRVSDKYSSLENRLQDNYLYKSSHYEALLLLRYHSNIN